MMIIRFHNILECAQFVHTALTGPVRPPCPKGQCHSRCRPRRRRPAQPSFQCACPSPHPALSFTLLIPAAAGGRFRCEGKRLTGLGLRLECLLWCLAESRGSRALLRYCNTRALSLSDPEPWGRAGMLVYLKESIEYFIKVKQVSLIFKNSRVEY